MAKAKFKTSVEPHQLAEKLQRTIRDLLDDRLRDIIGSTDEDGTARCTIAVRIEDPDDQPHCVVQLRWATRFMADAEFTCGDPNQPELLEKEVRHE